MKRISIVLGMFLSAAILLAQTRCSMIAGHLALAGGKKVYEKVEEDKAKKEQAKQE